MMTYHLSNIEIHFEVMSKKYLVSGWAGQEAVVVVVVVVVVVQVDLAGLLLKR